MDFYFYPNRTLCDIFSEMRKAVKTLNFSYMMSLIEEAQSAANRMEAALADQKDIESLKEQRSQLKKEVRNLKKEKEKLEPE